MSRYIWPFIMKKVNDDCDEMRSISKLATAKTVSKY